MGSERRLLRSDVADLRTLADYTVQGGLRARGWDHVNRMLAYSVKYGWLIRALSAGDWVRYTDGSADTVVRYFNDAVKFISTGKRDISIVTWDAIVRESIARDFHKQSPDKVNANIGSVILSANGMDHRSVGKPLVAANHVIDRSLLNYVEKEIILMWSMRPNGLEDMIYTLARLAEVMFALQNDDDDDD